MATPQPKPKPRPYRDFLTPSLHRRFTTAAIWSLGASLVLAAWLSFSNGLVAFAFMTTIRTATLFIVPLMVFIVRVGNVHVGSTSTSPSLSAFYTSVAKGFPVFTFWWYGLSALVFVETYIWSCSEDGRMEMVDRSKYERPRLNERPVFLRTMFLFTAFITAMLHLFYDRDRVQLRTTSIQPMAPPGQNTILQLREKAPAMLQRAITLIIALVPAGMFTYFIFLRGFATGIALTIAQQLFRVSHNGSSVGIPGLVSLVTAYAWTGFLLLLFWELANALYDVQIAQPPLKRGQPLTTDSKDPNASLVLGLKGRKEFAQNMAYWELVQIVNNFEPRRKTIFLDGSWAQISQACLAEIRFIQSRIEAYNKPATPPPQPPPQIQSLPRIGQPLKEGDIYTKPASKPIFTAEGAADAFGSIAKTYGNSPSGSPLSKGSKRLIEDAQKLLPPAQAKATGFVADILHSPLGYPFRQTFARRATAVVCGSPLSRTSTITAAVDAITKLVIHSLKEDALGNVSKDVLVIFKTLSGTLAAIANFLQTLPVQWTDVEFKDQDRHSVREVQEVQQALSKGLERLLLAYGEYLPAVGATSKDVREAKALIGQSQPPRAIEMEQVR